MIEAIVDCRGFGELVVKTLEVRDSFKATTTTIVVVVIGSAIINP